MHCVGCILGVPRFLVRHKTKATRVASLPVSWHEHILNLAKLAEVVPDRFFAHINGKPPDKDLATLAVIARGAP